ncbi:hypothetical protein [Enterobacter roggenkampii]|uniref:hypothetical protein n=1 Tax=Enterobacter roggenkampii TaxID=1812935 RepID=UPI0020213B99|nr:hypothetical protein [Enterobacter roggenkampii]MCL8153543.1 hypothetical protein [Enterobacter roggenkampii]MCM7560360.1 hypothetical protein [Enterobacter roggenkampii]
MDNRYEIAEQNGMSREFVDWFFDNKKAGCGNVWFMMMAAMWEGWQGRAAMLQGAENAESPTTMQTASALDSSPKIAESTSGNSPVITDDVRRMDWLVSKTVDVREPMVYGSHSLFWSQTITDEEDDYHATKLREQIDAAMATEQAAAPQQEVK